VLRGTALEHAPGTTAANGFLLDMPKLFEHFVTVALREALAPFGGVTRPQAKHHLDLDGLVPVVPDLVWHRDGAPAAVVDAKYKAEKPSGFPQADLYQMLAYCTVLGLPIGHLVYAKGNEEPARHVVCNAGIEIRCHALDLAQPPSTLLQQISGVAADLNARSSRV
jgi:5-methylcytosine-specific restriction enzyme subunit McrC